MKMVRVRGGRGPASIAVLVAVAVVILGVAGGPAAGPSSVAAAVTVPSARCSVKPTIVLVHGAWADASRWSGEVARLQRDGYVVRAIANPLRGLTSDAASVAAFLATLSGPIVLVGHSYSGAVITTTAAAGNHQVKALVYVDAAAPAVGETTAHLSGTPSALGAAPDTLYDAVASPDAPAGDPDLSLKERVFLQAFAPDLPAATARRLWASQRPAAMSAFMTRSAAAAWQTIPSWYVIGTADQLITPESQLFMAHRAHAHSRLVPGGSHLTLIAHPQAVTDQILAAAQAACSTANNERTDMPVYEAERGNSIP